MHGELATDLPVGFDHIIHTFFARTTVLTVFDNKGAHLVRVLGSPVFIYSWFELTSKCATQVSISSSRSVLFSVEEQGE